MLVLTRSDIVSILSIQQTIAVVEEGFARLAQGQVEMPQRAATSIHAYDGLHLSMPAFVDGEPGTLTVKVVTVYGQNPSRYGLPMIQGVILLHDARSGELLALMDAEHITAMRTGAASGVATKYMARADARTLLLFGAGAQAAAQIDAVCSVLDIEQVAVITRTGEKDAEFAQRMSIAVGVPVMPTRDIRKAVADADVICTATSSRIPLFNGDWLRPGTHVNAVGAYMHTMRELDAAAIQRSRVVVDHHVAAKAEAGDILLAIEDGVVKYDHVCGELGDVVLGNIRGRNSERDITLFKSVGLAMQDAVTVARVYTLAKEAGLGQSVEMQ